MYLNGHFYGEPPHSEFVFRMAIREAFINTLQLRATGQCSIPGSDIDTL